jgi:hypothetical protein
MPILVGLQTDRKSPIGVSLMVVPDIIYAYYEISTHFYESQYYPENRDEKDFSQVIPGLHLIPALRLYSFEVFLEGWIFFPEDSGFQGVGGLSIGVTVRPPRQAY